MNVVMRDRLKLAVFSFVALLPWIFFDIDLGDQSYHSLSSWLIAFHPKMPAGELPLWFEQVPVWFSYFVDSLWWRVIGPDASLLYVRFGWLLFQVLTVLGLFEAFRRLFPDRDIVWPLLLGLLAVNCAADDFVLSYYVVPPAFGALAFAFLAVSISDRHNRIFPFFAGVFAILSIQSRLPAAVPLGAALGVIFLMDYFLSREMRRETVTNFFWFFFGVTAGVLVAAICLYSSGQAEYFLPGLKSFWDGVSGATNARYSKGIVLERAVGHYARIFAGAAGYIFVLMAMRLVRQEKLSKAILLIAFTAVTLLSVAKYGTVLAIAIGGSSFLVISSAAKNWRNIRSWEIAIVLGSFACLSSFTLGTYLEGIQTFKYGLWLLVPFSLLISKFSDRITRIWLPGTIVILFFVTRILWPTFPYLERPIFQMTTPMEMQSSRGLWSYKEKVSGISGLVLKLGKLGLKPGDELLVYAGVPSYYPISGVYLLTRTVPLFHDPAVVEYPGARWAKHKIAIEAKLRDKTLPRFIVRQKEAFPRIALSLLLGVWKFHPEEPKLSFEWSNGQNNWLAGELDELLRQAEYRPIWENPYFVILAKP
jgi:hypothetical protein